MGGEYDQEVSGSVPGDNVQKVRHLEPRYLGLYHQEDDQSERKKVWSERVFR